MQLVRKFRIPALLCAFAVLLCELIARPFTTMGICDDGPYIRMAQTLAATGHIAYNGWSTAMLGWQLYLGAAFIKLFGDSFTTVRMSTLLIAMLTAFLLQRTLVRAGLSERNATLGTLALVLSPLYLILSVTFMTDINGLFAILLCLYGCLRALQASTSRATIAWLCFAVVANALCGTSRQIAWLGVLIMVPSTLWLLRAHRRVVLAGAAATLAGALFVFACLQWFKHQPYSVGMMPPLKPAISVTRGLGELTHALLDIPFLLLPVFALFLPGIWSKNRRSIAVVAAISLAYILIAVQRGYIPMLEPTKGDWVNALGMLHEAGFKGEPPVLLHTGAQVLLTIASLGGLLGLISSLLQSRRALPAPASPNGASWNQLNFLLIPFTLAYIVLLMPLGSTFGLTDRYLLGPTLVAAILLIRYYQERIQPQLPMAFTLLIALMAIYGVAATHNNFAFYRARVALAAELNAAGIPDTSVDNNWEYNFDVELQHTDHINDYRIVLPAHAYIPTPPLPAGTCPMYFFDETPHIRPIYGVSFDPNACYGPAPFAPIHYSRWLGSSPGTLHVVRYTPPAIH